MDKNTPRFSVDSKLYERLAEGAPKFTQRNKKKDPYERWPQGESYDDLREILQLILSRFKIPKGVISLVGMGLNITTGEKVERALKDVANHDIVEKYREKEGEEEED